MHIYIGDVISLQEELTFEDKSKFIHETLAPEFYKVRFGFVIILSVKPCSSITYRQTEKQTDRQTGRQIDR
jgi:hypothetical protein